MKNSENQAAEREAWRTEYDEWRAIAGWQDCEDFRVAFIAGYEAALAQSASSEEPVAGETYRDRFARDVLGWRGIGPEYDTKLCDVCSGSGYKVYGNTSTWRRGIGGSAMTTDVCDQCWGSGTDRPWPSHREIYAAKAAHGDVVLVPRGLIEAMVHVLGLGGDIQPFSTMHKELRALLGGEG